VRAALRQVGLVALAGVLAGLVTWAIARAWPDLPVERATVASVAFVPVWTLLAVLLLAWRGGKAVQRRLFALHRELGGVLALAAMLVFGTGVGAVLDRALTGWQVTHGQPVAVPELAEQPLDAVLAELLARHPQLVRGEVALHPASPEQPWIQADFFGPAREHVRLDFDARTGEPAGSGAGPLHVVRELHRRLLVSPLFGEPLLGLLGLALALVLVAGLATRRDWVRELFRRRARPLPVSMRAHQWVGLATLPAALVWAWSGALLGLTLVVVPIVGGGAYGGDRAALMRDVLAVDRPPLVDAAAGTASLQATIAGSCPLVREHVPEAAVHRVIVRHPGLASGTVRVDLEGEGLFERGSFTRAADGSLRDCRALAAAGVGLQAFMAAIVLHYGEWGPPIVVDMIYVVLGASLVALAWLGGVLLARRRERDGDVVGARRARRWLLGVGMGLPLAMTALMVLSRVPALARDESVALAVFAATLALALGLAWTGVLQRRAAWLLCAQGGALAAVPVIGYAVADVHPRMVESGFIALAAGCMWCGTRALVRASAPASREGGAV
jgi:hypothetical protein